MTRDSYLDPEAIKTQCKEAVQQLTNNNYWINVIKNCIKLFSENSELEGEAYRSLKIQLQDYQTILDLISNTNDIDVEDFYILSGSVGSEVLDGAVIFDMMDQALSDKVADEEAAESYETFANNASWLGEELYYRQKAKHYRKLVENDQKRYDEWNAKTTAYDDIELYTQSLFSKSGSNRIKIENALNGITEVFQGGDYQINANKPWRLALYEVQEAKTWEETVVKSLLEYGYTQEEINDLILHNVVITADDFETLKKSEGTTNIYLSEDKNALFYNGKIYYIDVPDKTTVCYDQQWETDYTIEKTQTDFDAIKGLTGIEGEEIPNEDRYTSDGIHSIINSQSSYSADTMKIAGGLSAFLLAQNFVLSGISQNDVTIIFESAQNSRKATILVGNSSNRQNYQNINYAVPVNTYKKQEDIGGKNLASSQAAAIYTLCTGIETDADKKYTITGTLDERHKEDSYYGYLSYSDNGTLQCTPIVYSGDTAYVATCNIGTGNNVKEIYDFTDKLATPTNADTKSQKIFETMLINN
jgi:hypothetical protein